LASDTPPKELDSVYWLKLPPRARSWLDGVSLEASFLWFSMQIWSADNGADGIVPKRRLDLAHARRLTKRQLTAALAELIEEGQLADEGEHYRLAIWEQPPLAVWQNDTLRERWARDKRLKRDKELCRAIKQRDRNLCRYCGRRVDWLNRNDTSPWRATYDHIDPDGENSLSNVVTACGGCNCEKKKQRTLEHAEMALFRPGTTAEQISAGATPMIDHRPLSERPQPGRGQPPPGQPGASRGPAEEGSFVAPGRDSGPGQPGASRPGPRQPDTRQASPGHAPAAETGSES
jgi:hypothetical protein